MQKVNERVDLSKKVLDIDIESPIFGEMLDNMNTEIERCIQKVYKNEFSAGEITLKLTIEIPEAFKKYMKERGNGDMVEEIYKYRKPNFKHAVTTTLKKQFKQEGKYSEEREVQVDDDGNYVAIPLINPQISMFEE